MMGEVATGLREALPGIVVSNPEASLYSVIDVRSVAPEGFVAADFVSWCATAGRVFIDGDFCTGRF